MPAPLPLDRVREIAGKHGYGKGATNEASRVISFRLNDTRINVYYTTGTVGTCVDHPTQGKTQLFRRDVNLQMLAEIFKNPRVHTDRGYKQRAPKRGRSGSPPPPFLSEEDEAKKYLSELEERRDALQEEIDSVKAFVSVYNGRRAADAAAAAARAAAAESAERERRAAEAEAERERARAARGKMYTGLFYDKTREFARENFNKMCTCVALSGDSDDVLMLFEHTNGYTGNIPKAVYNSLLGRNRHHPQPTYVSFGSQGRYYIEFDNGKSEWVGPDGLMEVLEGTSRKVASVAFGEGFDSYFVLYTDGAWCYNNIPPELSDQVSRETRVSGLQYVNLGPEGEYFLSTENGRMWWGGCNDEMLETIEEYKHGLQNILFGWDNTCLIRYTN